jgi:DNA-binding GntR family transcriptional regulator
VTAGEIGRSAVRDALLVPIVHAPPLRERVRTRLEALIIDGVYPPGTHLIETELATRLGVSRGPVREALNQLQSQGWVQFEPRRGAFVHNPTAEEIDEYFGVRAMLEGEAAALAAANSTDDDVAAMREVIAGARQALRVPDERALYEASAQFHGHVYQLSGNGVLRALGQEVDKRIRWYFRPVMMQRAPEAWDEHEAILEAIAAGDTTRSVTLMRQHSEGTRCAYLRMLDAQAPADAAPGPS